MFLSRKKHTPAKTQITPFKNPKTLSTLLTFNLSVIQQNSLKHMYTKSFPIKTVPCIFVLNWITDCTQVVSHLFTEKGLSVKSACILCSISMKWHYQTHLLTIQLYLQKYWDEIDDQSSLMFKHKLLPAVSSHLALVKFYCDWVPARHSLMGCTGRRDVLVGQSNAQPAHCYLCSSSNWRSYLESIWKYVGSGVVKGESLTIPISSCSQVCFF